MLTMAVITVVALVLGGVLTVFFVQRFNSTHERVRRDVNEELQQIQRNDQRLSDEMADGLASDAPIDEIIATHLRERAALVPVERATDRPGHWTADDLGRWQKGEITSRTQLAQRRCVLHLVLLASFLLVTVIAICAFIYNHNYSRQRIGTTAGTPSSVFPAGQSSKGTPP